MNLNQPMCADFKQFLNVWRIDCRPTSDFQRSVGVCVSGVPTSSADELCLAFSVSLIDVATLPASAGRVARIDKFNRDSCSLGFVQNKALQLVKRPAMQTTALSLTSPYPNANPLEVFHCDSASGALCSTYYLFRNYVVRICREPLLFTPSSAHQAFGTLRAFLLEFALQPNITSPVVIDGRAGEPLTVRSLSNCDKSKVYPNPLDNLRFFFVGNVHGRKQEPFFVPVNKVSLSTLKTEKLPVMLSAHKRDREATVQAPDAHRVLDDIPRQDAHVVANRAVFAERPLNVAVKFVGVSNLGYQPNHHLCGQREVCSNLRVAQLVQRKLAKFLSVPRRFAESVTGNIRRLKSAQQSVRLLGRGLEFYLSGQFHYLLNIVIYLTNLNTKNGFPPPAKAGGLQPKNL